MHGVLAPRVDVWVIEPRRQDLGGGDGVWLAPKDKDVDKEWTCLGDWTPGEARLQVRNGIPETSRECVRNGDPVVVTERLVS